MCIEGAVIETVDYKGRAYKDFYPLRNMFGPGWYVAGRNYDWYGGHLVHPYCGMPDRKPRLWRNYNTRSVNGWKTKREAQGIADAMNKAAA
jgi:hypothetical protein